MNDSKDYVVLRRVGPSPYYGDGKLTARWMIRHVRLPDTPRVGDRFEGDVICAVGFAHDAEQIVLFVPDRSPLKSQSEIDAQVASLSKFGYAEARLHNHWRDWVGQEESSE